MSATWRCSLSTSAGRPEQLTPEHARQYQLHLLKKKVSWSTFNQSVCALRFFYGTTLGRKEDIPRLPFGKKPKRIPVVLSREEVLKFLQCVLSRKQRMLLTTMYATGMRVREAVQLRVTDIDSRRMTILVAHGKGNKQRLVPLSPSLLTELRLFSHPKNADGPFYVENDSCRACNAPAHEAPELMGADGTDHCYFRRQPVTPEEVEHAIRACAVSCVEAVRYSGNDPAILQRFRELKSERS